MKIKGSVQSLLILILLLNTHCVELANKKALASLTNRKSKLELKFKATKTSHKLGISISKSKEPTTAVAVTMAALYLVNICVEAITSIINGYIAENEGKIKQLKDKSLSTLVNMLDEVKLIKSGMCSNVRNSNFLFFELLSFFILDIYSMRKQAESKNNIYSDKDFDIQGLDIKHNSDFVKWDRKLNAWVNKSQKKEEELKAEIKANDEMRQQLLDQIVENKEVKRKLSENSQILKNKWDEHKIAHPDDRSQRRHLKSERFSKISDKSERTRGLTQEELDRAMLMPYDQLSQSLFEVKQIMKNFQNKICSINDDVVGEMDFIEARSHGVINESKKKKEGSFFMISNVMLDFSTLFLGLGASYNNQVFLDEYDKYVKGTEVDESNLNPNFAINKQRVFPGEATEAQEKIKSNWQTEYANFGGSVTNPNDLFNYKNIGSEYSPTFKTNPLGFFNELKENIVNIASIYKIKGNDSFESKELLKQKFMENVVRFVGKLIVIADYIKVVIMMFVTGPNPGVVADFIKKISQPPYIVRIGLKMSVEENLLNLIKLYFAKSGGDEKRTGFISTEFFNKKASFSLIKLCIFLSLYLFHPLIILGFTSFIKVIAKILFKTNTLDHLAKASSTVLNVLIVLKLVVSLAKLVIAIIKLIKVKRQLLSSRIDFMGEEKLKDNYIQQLRIQAVYITFRHDSLILTTFEDILKFYETLLKVDLNSTTNKNLGEDEFKQLKIKNVGIGIINIDSGVVNKSLKDLENGDKLELFNDSPFSDLMKKLNGQNSKTLSGSRYNDLPLREFYLKFCQESETYCYNYITPKFLQTYHKNELNETEIDTIFKFIYNDIVAGPISDVYVATPKTTTLSSEFLRKNNFRFFKDKEHFGKNYALIYRRCGNANNYLIDFSFKNANLPEGLQDIFEEENKYKEKDLENIQMNTFFTDDVKLNETKTGFTKKYIMIKMLTTPGIDRLRGDEAEGDLDERDARQKDASQSNSSIKLIFSLNKAGNKNKAVYDFKHMYFTNTQSIKCNNDENDFYSKCWYLFSKVENETPLPFGDSLETQYEFKGMDTYVNSCYKNIPVSTTVVAMKYKSLNDSVYKNYLNVFTCAVDQDIVTHYTFYDKRFYTHDKDCSENFQLIDSRMVKINKHILSKSADSFLESQIKCFKEKVEKSKIVDQKYQVFQDDAIKTEKVIVDQKLEYLKSRIDLIKSAVCGSFNLFRDENRPKDDSKCTRAQSSDFEFVYIFFCYNDVLNYKVVVKHDKKNKARREGMTEEEIRNEDERNWKDAQARKEKALSKKITRNLLSVIQERYGTFQTNSQTMLYEPPKEKDIKEYLLKTKSHSEYYVPRDSGDLNFYGAKFTKIEETSINFCPQKSRFYGLNRMNYGKSWINFLRYENQIPPISFFTDMHIEENAESNIYNNLQLLRYNAYKFNEKQSAEDKKSKKKKEPNTPNLYKTDTGMYLSIKTFLFGDRKLSTLKSTRKGGIFHILLPVTREVDVELIGSGNSKFKAIGNIVFRVDRVLTLKIREGGEFQNNIIFKLANDKVKEKLSQVKESFEQSYQPNKSLKNIRNLKYDTRVNKKHTTLPELDLEFAPLAKNFYVEFRIFKKGSWLNFMHTDYKDSMNLKGFEYLLDLCFILYWPRLDLDDFGTEEFKAEQPTTTDNYYIPFRYSDKWTLMSRIWVKFDYHIVNKEISTKCGINEESNIQNLNNANKPKEDFNQEDRLENAAANEDESEEDNEEEGKERKILKSKRFFIQ